MTDRLLLFTAAWLLTAPLVASAGNGSLPVVIAGHDYQLPFRTEPVADAGGDPGLRVVVDLGPLLADRRTILQDTLALHDKCGLSADVTDVTLSPAPPGAHVRIEADFTGTLCSHHAKVASTRHHGHADATLTPVVIDHHRISFAARDGEISGEIAHFFKGEIRSRIEEAVQKSGPSFDTEKVVPALPFVQTIDVRDVRLNGSGNAWQIEAILALRHRP